MKELLQRIEALEPSDIEALTRWLDARGEYRHEQFVLCTNYNTSCGCHPEYNYVDIEGHSLADVIRQAIGHEDPRWSFKIDPNDIKVKRDMNEKELADATQLLADARQTSAHEKANTERNKKRTELQDEITRARKKLDDDRKDLNEAAILRRERAIAEKAQKLHTL